MTQSFGFEGRRFLVTGGSSGIGRAAVGLLHGAGAQVLATGTSVERLAGLRKDFPGVVALVNDAGDAQAADALAKALLEQLLDSGTDKLDGAFLNAGMGRFQPVEQLDAEGIDRHFAVNVRGPMLQACALAPLLADGGALVLNTSVARNGGLPGSAAYASTKGALRTLVRVLATEFAPRGIRVNAVSPGPIETGFFARSGMPQEAIDGIMASVKSRVPLGRLGRPEEAANVAAFLLSDLASYVTGSEYVVDGGMSEV